MKEEWSTLVLDRLVGWLVVWLVGWSVGACNVRLMSLIWIVSCLGGKVGGRKLRPGCWASACHISGDRLLLCFEDLSTVEDRDGWIVWLVV